MIKLLLDAQLPKQFAPWLAADYDVLHTSDLKDENRKTDENIIELATAHDRFVVTNDSDFVGQDFFPKPD